MNDNDSKEQSPEKDLHSNCRYQLAMKYKQMDIIKSMTDNLREGAIFDLMYQLSKIEDIDQEINQIQKEILSHLSILHKIKINKERLANAIINVEKFGSQQNFDLNIIQQLIQHQMIKESSTITSPSTQSDKQSITNGNDEEQDH